VVAGAKVDFMFSSATSPVFFLGNTSDVLVDWGDGDIGEHYVATSIITGYAPDADRLTVGERYTLTVYNSESVAFGKSGLSSLTNAVTKIHKFAGTRTSATYAFYRQKSLTNIAEGGLLLPNAKDMSYIFSECSGLGKLPDDFLTDVTPVTNMEGAFRLAGLSQLPPGFLSGAKNLSNAYRLFGYCPFTAIEKGLLGACVNLTNAANAFMNCTSLTSDINDIFSADSYPNMTIANSLFYGASQVTGEGLKLIEKMPALINHTQMFDGCKQLSDYSQIPGGYSLPVAGDEMTGE